MAKNSNLCVLGLWVVAFVQPILDMISKHGEMLVAHRISGAWLIGWTWMLTLGPPMIAALVITIAYRRSPRAGAMVTGLMVATLGSVLALQALVKLADPPAPVAWVVALAIGVLLAVARDRRPPVQTALAFLAVAAVVCPIVFLFTPSVRGLVQTQTDRDHLFEPTTPNPRARAPGAPIVFIVLDELPLISLLDPGGTINHRRYPHFARLASQSHWFRDATTVAQSTVFSLPAMLTGRDPEIRHLPTVTAYPHNLFTLLHASGYSLTVEEPLTDLCPPAWCPASEAVGPWVRFESVLRDLAVVHAHLTLPTDGRRRLPPVNQAWAHFMTADAQGDAFTFRHAPGLAFERFTDSIQPAEGPSLHFLHVLLPHMPWRYLPSGRRFDTVPQPAWDHGLENERWQGTASETVQAYQLHLLQLAYTDTLLGALLDRLEDLGLLDASLLVVTADHGASFQPGAVRRKLTEHNQAEIANVPLFIKLPHQRRGVVDDRNVMTTDLLPTLAAAVGVALHEEVDGHDLFAEDDATRLRGDRKWTFATGGRGGGIGERFVFDQRQLAAQRERFVARKRGWFGRAPRRLYAIGPHRKLVGRQLDQLPRAPHLARGTGTIDQVNALAAVSPHDHHLPARLTGRLDGFDPHEAPNHLAVAVHGVIQATVIPYRDPEGALRYTAMVGEHALREGSNPVTLLAIQGPPGSATLAPIITDSR